MTFTDTVVTSEGNGTSHTVALPDGSNVVGSIVLIGFSVDGNPTVTWPGTGVWTRLFTDVTVSESTLSVVARVIDGTEGFPATGATISVSTGAASERSAHAARLISAGHDASTFPEGASATGSSATPDPPNLTPSWGAEENLWVPFAALRFAGSFTAAPTDYTNLVNLQTAGGDAGATIGSARRELNAASENPGGFTQNGGSMLWVAATVAIRPSAGGGPSEVNLTPAVIVFSAVALDPDPQPVDVDLTPAVIVLSAVALDPVAQPVDIDLTPAVVNFTAVPLDPDPQPVDVDLTPAVINFAAVALDPEPQVVNVDLTPAIINFTAPALSPGGGAIDIDLTPAIVTFDAVALDPVSQPVDIDLTPAVVTFAGIQLDPVPGVANIDLTPAVIVFVAVPLGLGSGPPDGPRTLVAVESGHTLVAAGSGHTLVTVESGHTLIVAE